MAQRDKDVPHLEQVEGGATAEHRRIGDIQFGTLHVLPTLLSTPNAHAIFWLLQLLHRKTRDCRDHLQSRKPRSARKEGGLRLKTNGGQAVCGQRREQSQPNDGASAH